MDKLKLKEQIRNDAFKMSGSMGTDAIDYAWDRIEEYATQQSRIDAINFYNWIENENTIWHNEQEEPLTDDELYELYQSQKPKQ